MLPGSHNLYITTINNDIHFKNTKVQFIKVKHPHTKKVSLTL